jgi:hypothetical protein
MERGVLFGVSVLETSSFGLSGARRAPLMGFRKRGVRAVPMESIDHVAETCLFPRRLRSAAPARNSCATEE